VLATVIDPQWAAPIGVAMIRRRKRECCQSAFWVRLMLWASRNARA